MQSASLLSAQNLTTGVLFVYKEAFCIGSQLEDHLLAARIYR
jgi:hypothetical protein